jgi:hypothetical protein
MFLNSHTLNYACGLVDINVCGIYILSSSCIFFHETLYVLPQIEQEYVDSGSPHAVNTAMAMLALLYAGQVWLIYISIFVLFLLP